MKNLLLIISILFISTIQAFACFAEEIEFSEDINFRTANSELIVEGKVVNQEGFWNEDKTLIYTAHEVQLYKVLKGKATTDRVIVISEGGVVGNKSMTNTVSPEIALNDYGVFFVNPVTKSYKFNGTDLSYQYFTSLYFKAFIKYNTTKKSAFINEKSVDVESGIHEQIEKIVKQKPILIKKQDNYSNSTTYKNNNNWDDYPVIDCFYSNSVRGGIGDLVTVEGYNFGTYDNGQTVGGLCGIETIIFKKKTYVRSDYIKTWTDTKIEFYVPNATYSHYPAVTNNLGLSTIFPRNLEVRFNISNTLYGQTSAMIGRNNEQGYDLYICNSADDNGLNMHTSPARASFEQALSVAQQKMGINFNVVGTTQNNSGLRDNECVIRFQTDNLEDTLFNNLGVLAYARIHKSACPTTNVIEVEEFDIVFRKTPHCYQWDCEWHYTSTTDDSLPPSYISTGPNYYDFQSVAIHEIGHCSLLGHTGGVANFYQADLLNTSSHSRPCMYPSWGMAEHRRTPRACSDVQGAQYVNDLSINHSNHCATNATPYQVSNNFTSYSTAQCTDPITDCTLDCSFGYIQMNVDVPSNYLAEFNAFLFPYDKMWITSEVESGAKVEYNAQTHILLLPGFETQLGSVVCTNIKEACTGDADFPDFPWINSIFDLSSCCASSSISLYVSPVNVEYIVITFGATCGNKTVSYLASNGAISCSDPSPIDCIQDNGLEFVELLYLNGACKTDEVAKPEIEENILVNPINIYPNPAQHFTNIDFNLPEESEVTISLFDIQGKEIKQIVNNEIYHEGFNQITLDCSDVLAGTYFCSILINDKMYNKKLIILE